MRHPSYASLLGVAALTLSCFATESARGAIATDQLLPMTTKGYLAIPDVERLEKDFDETQLGQLMADPVMKPFSDDVKRQLREKWRKLHEPLGLSWDDLEGVPGGEVAMARIQPAKDQSALVMVVDITGKAKEADELLAKIDRNLTEKKATKKVVDVEGVALTVYTRSEGPDEGQQSVFFIQAEHQQLVATDNLDQARGILRRFAGAADDSLAAVPAYRVTMQRVLQAQGDEPPHLRWFLEPFGYVEARRVANPPRTEKKGKDLLTILRNQGFTAIQGLGGLVTFHDGSHDILHRTAVFAPAVEREPGDPNRDKYDLAMRMLNFPNKGGHQPPAWIPRDLAAFVSIDVDLQSGFEYAKTLVNEMADDEIFEDVIRSLKEDPNGPRVDVRKEVVAHLGAHVMVMSDYSLPITPDSERLLVAVELTDVEPVTRALNKTMENDPNAVRETIAGHTVWAVREEVAELPEFDFQFDDAIDVPDDELAEEEERALPASAATVAHGHLLIGSHVEIIRRVLEEADLRRTLAGSVDYQLVQKALAALGADSEAAQAFSRTDEEFRATYELIKQGRMPESKTLMGRLLNMVFDDGDDETTRDQEIDGSKLPEYQMVRRYLGPAGLYVTTLDDGWIITGCFLSKENLQVVLKSD